jgi:SAM-dependent MidA family methyltransferase
VVVVDYADVTASLARRPWTEWTRTYRGHGRGSGPLSDLGGQDVTCEVAVDQLPGPTSNRSQAEFLRAFGVDELAAAARRAWEERAHIGDLEALRARSRVHEAAALIDPAGLGAFRVLEWVYPGREAQGA